MKTFHLGDILSITTEVLVSPRKMEGVEDILSYMTGDQLWSHQLPRVAGECKPQLLCQHPQLADISSDGIGRDNWKPWLADLICIYGKELEVEPMPKGGKP